MDSLNGKWKGKYTFDEPEADHENKEHHFEMTMFVDDDDVTGEIKDISENDQTPGLATVGGFIDGDEISFIKQYPFLHLKNELNETIVDNSKQHPEIHYHGVVNEELIIGTWEMEAAVIMSAGQYHSKMINGKWELRKEED